MVNIFKGAKTFIACRIESNTMTLAQNRTTPSKSLINEHELFFQIGTIVKIKWVQDQLGVGWRPGWYTARVQYADLENDSIDVVYDSQPDILYTVDVGSHISTGKIKLLKK